MHAWPVVLVKAIIMLEFRTGKIHHHDRHMIRTVDHFRWSMVQINIFSSSASSSRNVCFCGNDLDRSSINSRACQTPCKLSWNDMSVDCCGGLHVQSVFDVHAYRMFDGSSATKGLYHLSIQNHPCRKMARHWFTTEVKTCDNHWRNFRKIRFPFLERRDGKFGFYHSEIDPFSFFCFALALGSVFALIGSHSSAHVFLCIALHNNANWFCFSL